MKLQQGQTWKCSEEFVRIVHLERLEVGYKSFKSLTNSEGKHHRATRKDFCRMLKGATLLTGEPEALGGQSTAIVSGVAEGTGLNHS